MKFGLAGGGTGGHTYPAVAVAERLREHDGAELVYYGTPRGPERAVAEAEGFEYRPVRASPVRSRSPWRIARGALNLARGYREALRWLEGDAPSAVFATGGYAAAPVGRAARKCGIPLLVFLPDVRPGWAVRSLQRQATAIACSVSDSLEFLPGAKTVVTGYPVRRQFAEAQREEGARRFGLDPALSTLLVTGGSQGAHHINLVIVGALRRLLEQTQIIHIAGRDEEAWLARERERLPDWQRDRYQLRAYTEEMAWAMAASDLAVTRAGASALGELPAAGLPAIVIPGDFSDQRDNADFLVRHGAALALPSAEIERLEDEVARLIEDDETRGAMAEAMGRLARPDAASKLAAMLVELAA
jgi:UDP-N-acetylglucosamine--N-acetylmuramyl-(pentapeptide) pyrophosphoryl-undecaprenol N-acetylglucosamine transferase